MTRDEDIARNFDLKNLSADFYEDPFITYRALRNHAPVKRLPDGGVFLSRFADVSAVYRDAATLICAKIRCAIAPLSAPHHQSRLQ